MTTITVRATHDHGNPFGDKYEKKVGDEYSIPADALGTLKGLAEKVTAHEGESSGPEGAGTGAKRPSK